MRRRKRRKERRGEKGREEKILKMEAGGIKEKKREKAERGRLLLTFPLKDPPEIAKDGGTREVKTGCSR